MPDTSPRPSQTRCPDRSYDDPGRERRVLLKHFSLDHRFVIVDNEDRWIEDVYRDDNGNLHIRIGGGH